MRLIILSIGSPSIPPPPPLSSTQCVIISTQKGHFFSAPKTSQFHTENPSVPHQKPRSSTPSVSHHKPLSSTHHSVLHQKSFSSTHPSASFVCGTEECVELRGLCCGTEGVLVLNWEVFIFINKLPQNMKCKMRNLPLLPGARYARIGDLGCVSALWDQH